MKNKITTLLRALHLYPAVRFGIDSTLVFCGMIVHRLTNKTPPSAYQAMIRLFCSTRGKSNDFISKVISFLHPPTPIHNTSGILGEMNDATLNKVAEQLRKDGYYIFDQKLSPELCDRLLQYALTQPAEIRGLSSKKVYNRETPQGVRYDFPPADLIKNPDVKKLMTDPSLIALSQKYLGSKSILDIISMWWHTSFSKEPDSEAAQFFPFRYGPTEVAKVLFYLTDVGPQNGPHCFITGSHQTNAMPPELLNQGYARLSDEAVRNHFPLENFMEFTGPRGLILAEDTRGLHKGKHVMIGDRLILQLQFSNSLFGASSK